MYIYIYIYVYIYLSLWEQTKLEWFIYYVRVIIGPRIYLPVAINQSLTRYKYNTRIGKMWKESVMAILQVLHLPRGSDRYHEKTQVRID